MQYILALPLRLTCRSEPDERRKAKRRDDEGETIERESRRRTACADDQGTESRAGNLGKLKAQGRQTVGARQKFPWDDFRDDGPVGGPEKRADDAEQQAGDVEMPEFKSMREGEHGDDADEEAAQDDRQEHHARARVPVNGDSADEQKDEHRR